MKLNKILRTKKSQKWWKLPSDSYRLGGAVAGDDGDESREVCVLITKNKTNKNNFYYNIIYYNCKWTKHTHTSTHTNKDTVIQNIENDVQNL